MSFDFLSPSMIKGNKHKLLTTTSDAQRQIFCASVRKAMAGIEAKVRAVANKVKEITSEVEKVIFSWPGQTEVNKIN